MKNCLKLLTLLLVGTVFFSCNDEFTEEDAMNALQRISLQVSVHDASKTDAALSGAVVSAVIDTSIVSVTTNSNGVAVFNDLKIGSNINLFVSKDSYTTAFASVNTTPGDYRQTVVGADVYLYATAGENVVTIKGQLTIETNLTNRQREMASDVTVIAYNSSLYNTTTYFVDTSDASGNYSIAVPVDGNGGNEIYVYFPTIERNRIVGRNIDNIYSIETKTASYSASNYGETAVDRVPSTLIEIEAPPPSGSGFELGLQPVRVALSTAVDNEFTESAIISGGSGYNGTENFVFAEDPDGAQAELNVTVNSGIISSISIVDNGATYTSMPAIVASPVSGSGAVFDLRFRYLYRVYISNHGSGYINTPLVGVDYSTVLDNTSKLRKEFEPDMDDYNPLGGGDLYNNAIISGGSIIVVDETDGDTLFSTGYVYSLPVFTYSNEDKQPAVYYAELTAVNTTDGSLTDNFDYNTEGFGYDFANPPAVTVTALAGYGAGAVVRAEVNLAGEVSNLVVMAKGSGYIQDINDYDGDGNYNEEEDADLIGFSTWSTGYGRHDNCKPGMTYTGDVFYGTGMEKKQ